MTSSSEPTVTGERSVRVRETPIWNPRLIQRDPTSRPYYTHSPSRVPVVDSGVPKSLLEVRSIRYSPVQSLFISTGLIWTHRTIPNIPFQNRTTRTPMGPRDGIGRVRVTLTDTTHVSLACSDDPYRRMSDITL